MQLEEAGIPTVVLVTDAFEALARQAAEAYAFARARVVVVPHPLGGVADDMVRAKGGAAVEAVLGLLTPG